MVFLGGYASDMTGTKARYLEDWCRARDRAFVRFDYRGTGARRAGSSTGPSARGVTMPSRSSRRARGDVCSSSDRAWARGSCSSSRSRSRARIHALVGVAAAPDFTEDLLWARLGEVQRGALRRDGVLHLPSAYGEPMPFGWRLVEDGRQHLVLRSPFDVPGPVRLLHGTQDADVPWDTSMRLAETIRDRDVAVTLVKDGGHRLSEPHELSLLGATVASLL